MSLVTREDGTLTAVTGASRSGKTASVLQQVRNDARVLTWDPQGDWVSHGFDQVTEPAELMRRIRGNKGAARICYKREALQAEFEVWARAALLWGMLKPCTAVAEELAWVTSQAKAPRAWHALVTGGLKYGINIIGITQRPSESDKTILGNATSIRCFRMQRANDRKYMANEMNVELAQISALKDLDFVQVNPGTSAEPESGRLTF